MKKTLIIVTLLLIFSCKSGYIKKELKSNLFEKFDYQLWKRDFKEFPKGAKNDTYIYKSLEFYPDSDINWLIYIYPQKQQFYTVYNEYYVNTFNLKRRGKFFGDDYSLNRTSPDLKIGIWYEYDENGNLVNQIDEDKKFGGFGYNELLKFLDKENQINLRKGVERDDSGTVDFETIFYYSNDSGKKLWLARTKIKITDLGCNENGSQAGYKSNSYFIDGNTGQIIARKDLINYKDIIPGFEKKYPELK